MQLLINKEEIGRKTIGEILNNADFSKFENLIKKAKYFPYYKKIII